MSSPAGWYPQPDGQQRYWDGQQWTEHFAPGVTPETSTGVSGVTPTVAARKNWFLRHKVLTAIGAVLLLGMMSSLANGGGSKPERVATIDQVATTTTPDNAAADKAAAELAAANQAAADKAAAEVAAASKVAEDKAAADQAAADKAAAEPQLGKKVLDGKFAFTVTAIKCGIAR